jgi:tetratricopeptide (TPR) repeat protein
VLLAWLACGLAARAEVPVRTDADGELAAALRLVYDGDFAGARGRLHDLARAQPSDPAIPYLEALALEWQLEQHPQSHEHDGEVVALAERALALARSRLDRDGKDGRALLATGAAHGIESRLYLFRGDRGPASREAVRMREALLAARAAGVDVLDLDFGLGLYDYYASTLPRLFKVVAFLLRIPGGDEERGKEAIARVARGGSLFHDDEARVQMWDIYTWFEPRPDRALPWARDMWRRYPGWPRWGLKLAELLRAPLGLYEDSAAVARTILRTAEEHLHPNYQPVVAAMARVLLGEALLGQRLYAQAREAAAPACTWTAGATWVAPRAELVVGRSLEMEGEADAARAHYERAAAALDPSAARRAQLALAHPVTPGERRADRFLREAQSQRSAGRPEEAEALCLEAFRAFPADSSARLCAGRASLRAGRAEAARTLARAVLDDEDAPPHLRPQAWLLLGAASEKDHDPRAAVLWYRRAWDEPYGRAALRAEAARAIERLQPGTILEAEPPLER